nr:ribonuclease H-like domain, reverse transcriptase, RNA-dependent DNA polymerase [Tanacetum cinerariifolium]
SDLGNHQPTTGIFSSSSYDDDFCADVINLASNVVVDPVATKRVNTIHPQSQIIRALQSPVQTRGTMQKSKFGESAFISYVHNQNRSNNADHLHCLFACFLSQLEPSSVAKALEDPDWVAAMQEEIEQFYHQQVWKLVPLPARKIAISTKWILKNKRDAKEIVVRNKARLVAQGHRQEGALIMISAFLYGEIEEEVYVTQPKGFEYPHNPKYVYRVVKALYGLHQAPRACQDKYVKDMLKKFDMESVRTATTPYEVPKHKSKDEPNDVVNVHLFRSMIGSLMYLTSSRPDIMFAVSACSRHQVTPLTSHLNAVKKIFKYLKGKPNLGLWYPRDSPFQLKAYSNSGYAGSYGDRKSTTGGCQFLGRRLISWQCKKQSVVATSSTKAEYVAVASCCGQVLLLVVLVRADDLVPAGSCIIPTGSYSFMLMTWFLLVVVSFLLVGIQTSDPSPRPTFDFTAKLFSNMKLNWDGPHMPLLASMLVVLAGGDGADAVAAGAAAAHDVSPPPIVPPTHSTPGPSSALQGAHTSPVREPTPDSPKHPFPPPRTEEVSPTPSTRPPSPTRHISVHEDISKGGGDFVSSPQSNEAPQTPAATTAGGAEDSPALNALSFKLDRCLHRVTTLENELGITKKVLSGAVLKLVTRVKRLEGLLQQRKRRLVLSDFEGDDATPTEHDIDLASLHTLAHTSFTSGSFDQATGPDAAEVLAYTTMPFCSSSTMRRRLKKTFTTSASAHVPENIHVGASIPAAATTILVGSSVATVVHAAATPSSSIPTAADKGKAPMELAKKIHAEQDVEFSKKQEELAQKAQAERVASPTEHGPGMSDQRDDVTKENMNERLGMLILRKRRELAEQPRVKPMTKIQQRDYMRDFVKNTSASVYNQGWTMKKVPAALSHVPAGILAALSFPADVSVHAATSSAHADILVPVVSPAHAAAFVPTETVVYTAKSHLDDPLTASEHVSTKPTVAAPTPSSSYKRRKHISKKRVTPIVDMADAAMIKFDSDSDRQLAHSQLAIISSCTSSCVGDGGWMGNPYVCRCLLSSHCSYFRASAETWIEGFSCWFSTTPQMVFSSPWFTAKKELTHHEDRMLLFHDPTVFGVPADISCGSPYSCWFLVAAVWLVAAGFVLFMLLE